MTREQFEDRISAEAHADDERDAYRDEIARARRERERWHCKDRLCGAEDCRTCHPRLKYFLNATDSRVRCPQCHGRSIRLYRQREFLIPDPRPGPPPGWRYGCRKCDIIFVPP